MSISVACQSCLRRFIALDEAGGRTIKCPKCGSKIEVAKQPQMNERSQKVLSTANKCLESTRAKAIESIPAETNNENAIPTPEQVGNNKTRYRLVVLAGGLTLFLIVGGVSTVCVLMSNRERNSTSSIQGIEQEEIASDADSENNDAKLKKVDAKKATSPLIRKG